MQALMIFKSRASWLYAAGFVVAGILAWLVHGADVKAPWPSVIVTLILTLLGFEAGRRFRVQNISSISSTINSFQDGTRNVQLTPGNIAFDRSSEDWLYVSVTGAPTANQQEIVMSKSDGHTRLTDPVNLARHGGNTSSYLITFSCLYKARSGGVRQESKFLPLTVANAVTIPPWEDHRWQALS